LLTYSYFTTIPGGQAAGAGGNKIKANSAQLNLAGAWAELGKKKNKHQHTPTFQQLNKTAKLKLVGSHPS
jgi:hypothetical protein